MPDVLCLKTVLYSSNVKGFVVSLSVRVPACNMTLIYDYECTIDYLIG